MPGRSNIGGNGAFLEARKSFVNDPAGCFGRTPNGRVRRTFPIRREDSTAVMGIRLMDWRWAFVFNDAGCTEMCDCRFRGMRNAITAASAFAVPSPSGDGDFTRLIVSVQGMQLTSIQRLLARICDYSAQAGSDNSNVKDARFRKESGVTRSTLSGRSPSTRSVLDISSDSDGV